MNENFISEEVDKFWPNKHALKYYKEILAGLLVRVEDVKEKIEKLEGRDANNS